MDYNIHSLTYNRIQEAHPLKQGLKLVGIRVAYGSGAIQEAHPLKQGLKQATHEH